MKVKSRRPPGKSFKNNRRRNVDPPNLARYRASILQLTKGQDDQPNSQVLDNASSGTSPAKRPTKSRKERRKEARKQKKATKDAYHRGTLFKSKDNGADSDSKVITTDKPAADVKDSQQRKLEQEKKKKEDLKKKKEKERMKKAEESKKQGLLQANLKEDRLIKTMEKSLKMKRRKSKNLPRSFLDDGLDFLLDAVDAEKIKSLYNKEEENSDMDEDAESVMSKSEDSEADEFNSDEEEDDGFSESDDQFDEEDDDDDSVSDERENISTKSKSKKLGKRSLSSNDSEDETDMKESTKKHKATKSAAKTVSFTEQDGLNEDDEEENDGFSEGGSDGESEEGSGESEGSSDGENEEGSGESEEGSDGESEEEELKDTSRDKESSRKDQTEKADGYREDIYGRLRDSAGNVVTQSSVYVPPGKRKQMNGDDAKKKEQKMRLNRQIKGLLNRLSEANLQGVSGELEAIYMKNSRADVNEALTSLILNACVQRILIPERLIMEHVGLMTLLHNNIGSEIGAEFLHSLIQQFKTLQTEAPSTSDDSKQLNNILVVLAHLYNFKVIDSVLIFDVLKELTEQFEEKQIELILLLLKNVGFLLRKDDAATLKTVIIQIQQKANALDMSKVSDQSRIKFMLEIITAIKNNNMRRIPNYDPAPAEHLKKLLRSFCRGGTFGEEQLRLPLADLLNAEQKGRWWLVGSAWAGRSNDEARDGPNESKAAEYVTDMSDKVAELAHEQRMNTDIRRAIFSSLITSEDFVDAFNKLLRLGLKQSQERDLIYVTVDCCLQEKSYNPFYVLVVQKFCEYHRRFQMSLQCHVWDKFRSLSELSEQRRFNLGKLLVHLISTHAVSLSVLKVLEWGDLTKLHVRLLKQILTALLTDFQVALVAEVFGRIAGLPKLEHLREGLRIFIKHFLLRGKSVNEQLREAAKKAESAMLSSRPKLKM